MMKREAQREQQEASYGNELGGLCGRDWHSHRPSATEIAAAVSVT